MQHVFGPVPSRRLGYSLGVDIVPPKYCSFDCIYCQIGKTTHREMARRSFYDPEVIVGQVIEKVEAAPFTDHITFSGSGEPTLNADLGKMIAMLKDRVSIPIAVITNGSLLHNEDVRRDLARADVILPSLDAVSPDVFERINRPHPSCEILKVIDGLKALRKEFAGQIWLEIMVIKGVNDSPGEIERMARTVAGLGMDRIQLNSVTRPPSEQTARRLTEDELREICRAFGHTCEVIASFDKSAQITDDQEWTRIIVETLKRRPLTLDDIVRTTGLKADDAQERLTSLRNEGAIRSYAVGDDLFYVIA